MSASDIDALAYRFWSVHPKELDVWEKTAPTMPASYAGGIRAWFFATEMRMAFGAELDSPTAWRWSFDGGETWDYGSSKPECHSFFEPSLIETLYRQPASTALVDAAHDLISDWLQEGVEDLPDDTPVNVNIGGRLIIHNKLGDLRTALRRGGAE